MRLRRRWHGGKRRAIMRLKRKPAEGAFSVKALRGIGFSSGVYEDPGFEHLRRNLTEAAALGVDYVELPVFAMDVIAGGRILQPQLKRLKEATSWRGLGYTVHGPLAVNLMQTPELLERHVKVAKATIELAAEIGAAHVVFHTGNIPAENDAAIEAAYGAQRITLAELGDIAAGYSIILAIENIFASDPGVHTALPSRLARELVAINHPNVRGCLDFSHAALACTASGADYFKEVGALAPVSRHLHIHDSCGDPLQIRTYTRSERVAFGIGDLHLPLGWGNLPWHNLMEKLSFEPDVIFNLELPVPYWFALAESVSAMREMAQLYKRRRAND
jgi:sugar phosphate isomerase/epimerase